MITVDDTISFTTYDEAIRYFKLDRWTFQIGTNIKASRQKPVQYQELEAVEEV
jgi:hypothetical protein